MAGKSHGITIQIAREEVPAVLRALRDRATYLKGYSHDSTEASILERVAEEIEAQK